MKINPIYKLREVAGESVIVRQGRDGADLTRIISLNPTARLLFEHFSGKEFTAEDAANLLADTYHIDHRRALDDATRWTDELQRCGLLED